MLLLDTAGGGYCTSRVDFYTSGGILYLGITTCGGKLYFVHFYCTKIWRTTHRHRMLNLVWSKWVCRPILEVCTRHSWYKCCYHIIIMTTTIDMQEVTINTMSPMQQASDQIDHQPATMGVYIWVYVWSCFSRDGRKGNNAALAWQ